VEKWVRGKCEEAMKEVLGAGRGVQAGEVEIPAMAAEAGRETRQGAESDERRATDATGHKIATQHTKPQGFIIRPPLLTTNKVLLNCLMLRIPKISL
jgi:hypothetical protein